MRAAARRRALPAPAFVTVEGAGSSDTAVMQRALAAHVGSPLDIAALDTTLTGLGGLGRDQALTWELVERDGMTGLVVRALPKLYAPPFLFLAVSLENTTSNTFQFGLGARYLAYDTVGSGSELRVDGAIGLNPSAAVALYRLLGSTSFFVEPSAGVGSQKLNVIDDYGIVVLICGVGDGHRPWEPTSASTLAPPTKRGPGCAGGTSPPASRSATPGSRRFTATRASSSCPGHTTRRITRSSRHGVSTPSPKLGTSSRRQLPTWNPGARRAVSPRFGRA